MSSRRNTGRGRMGRNRRPRRDSPESMRVVLAEAELQMAEEAVREEGRRDIRADLETDLIKGFEIDDDHLEELVDERLSGQFLASDDWFLGF